MTLPHDVISCFSKEENRCTWISMRTKEYEQAKAMFPRAWKTPHTFWAGVTVPMLIPVRLPLKVPVSIPEPIEQDSKNPF